MYKNIMTQAGGRFTENDVIIGAHLARAMPQDMKKKIDTVNLSQSSRIKDNSLYSGNGTSYDDFWTKIGNFEPPEATMKAFAVAIKAYLYDIYRENYDA